MKIQLEELDVLRPWPTFELRQGYYAIRVLLRVGAVPFGEVMVRPARRKFVLHQRLRRRIAKRYCFQFVKLLSRFALAAGADTIANFPNQPGKRVGTAIGWKQNARLLAEELLDSNGLPAPWPAIIEQANRSTKFATPPVTVVICTRDRAQQLRGCIEHLLELDYPDCDILIVDNSSDALTHETQAVAETMGVNYTREPRAGLSWARNAGMRAARSKWVAFTDDDCRPEPSWLRELARELQDSKCACVTGLVLPAQLENSAEITFEIYGGLGRGYAQAVYDRGFLRRHRWAPGKTWNLGAGANQLLDRDLVLNKLGGYDVDMGPGPNSIGGCGEDTDIYYQVLDRGYNLHYTPRAIVHHYHRSSEAALRKHIHNYAVGHAAYHVRCLFRYRDHRSLMQLIYYLPRWFARNWKRGILGQTKYPHSLVYEEVRGTIRGVIDYSWLKIRKYVTAKFSKQNPMAEQANVEVVTEPTDKTALVAVPAPKAAKFGDAA